MIQIKNTLHNVKKPKTVLFKCKFLIKTLWKWNRSFVQNKHMN